MFLSMYYNVFVMIGRYICSDKYMSRM